MQTRQSTSATNAFTLIELLTVIAIIGILIAILFPVFGVVREQARQANTISSLHDVYVGCRQYYDDEGQFPPALYGYAEVHDTSGASPIDRVALSGTDSLASITPMDKVTNSHPTSSWLQGYLWNERTKSFTTYVNADNQVTSRTEVTAVCWPIGSPLYVAGCDPSSGSLAGVVTWQSIDTSGAACPVPALSNQDWPDMVIPPSSSPYNGTAKLFYVMDGMDIGPMLDDSGTQMKDSKDNPIYELHYSPDWTTKLGATCDVPPATTGPPYVQQLKYKNPPTDSTVITYVTQHTATAGSSNVIVLLDSGTIRKVNFKDATVENPVTVPKLPLSYVP